MTSVARSCSTSPTPRAPTRTPPRRCGFLPEFDALGLGHDDRSRLVDDAHRLLLFRPNLRNPPMFLVDGRVAGTREIEAKKKLTSIVLTPYIKLTKKVQGELGDEAEAMARFIEPEAKAHDVRIVTPAKGREASRRCCRGEPGRIGYARGQAATPED